MAAMSNNICSLISGATGYQSAPMILIILSSMMLTYSLSDIIYGQILIPMKKEKYYLIAMLIGTVVNVGLSIILGYTFLANGLSPAIGVAIGTVFTDVLVLAFLLIKTWKWSSKALFNVNTLKLIIATALILGVTLALNNPQFTVATLWSSRITLTSELSKGLTLIVVVLIDAIIYVGSLVLMKENLISSFLKKKELQVEEK